MRFHNVCPTYAAAIALGTVYAYFYLPETRGKTLKEIEDSFRGDNNQVTGGGQASEKLMPGSENFELFRSDGQAARRDSAAGKVMIGPSSIREGKLLGTKFPDGLT
jgi:hypothetical protein